MSPAAMATAAQKRLAVRSAAITKARRVEERGSTGT